MHCHYRVVPFPTKYGIPFILLLISGADWLRPLSLGWKRSIILLFYYSIISGDEFRVSNSIPLVRPLVVKLLITGPFIDINSLELKKLSGVKYS